MGPDPLPTTCRNSDRWPENLAEKHCRHQKFEQCFPLHRKQQRAANFHLRVPGFVHTPFASVLRTRRVSLRVFRS
jgi:hypothetical protein